MEEKILKKLDDIDLQIKVIDQKIEKTKDEIKNEIKEELDRKLRETEEKLDVKLKETQEKIEKNVSAEIQNLCESIERVENKKHQKIVEQVENNKKKTLKGVEAFRKVLVS